MGTKNQAENGKRPSGMEEHFIGSQGQQWTIALEKEEEEEENDLNKVNCTLSAEYVRKMFDKYGSQGHNS